MPTVTSLTATRILELLTGFDGLAEGQAVLDGIIAGLSSSISQHQGELDNLNNVVLPELNENLASNQVLIDDLNENVLPGLQASLDAANADIEDINSVVLPALSTDLGSLSDLAIDQPQVFRQPEPPTNDDIEFRDLQLGDVWYDTDNGNAQYMWNGVEWSTFGIDIPDLSLTVKKFNTSTHMIY